MAVGLQGAVEVALFHQDAAHQVVGVGGVGFCGQHRLDQLLGRRRVAHGHAGAGLTQAGPWRTGRLRQFFEDEPGVFGAFQAQEQFGHQAATVGCVGQLLLVALQGPGQGHFRLAAVQGLQDVAQFAFSVACLCQPLAQQGGGVGADQNAVQGGLCSFHDLVEAGLRRHHQEHGAVRQLVFAPQFVQQVLTAVVTALEFAVADDDVEGLALDQQARLLHSAGLRNVAHTRVAQLVSGHAAEHRVGFHQQSAGKVDVAVDHARTCEGA